MMIACAMAGCGGSIEDSASLDAATADTAAVDAIVADAVADAMSARDTGDDSRLPIPDAGLAVGCLDPCTEVVELGANSARIEITLTQNGPARISYGTTRALGQATEGEYSSEWGAIDTPHRQRVTGLAADTTYFYRVDTLDRSDAWVAISPIGQFRTRGGIATPTCPHPDQAFCGQFIGSGQAGRYGGANSQVFPHLATRFVAQRTGNIVSWEYALRALRRSDYEGRCANSSTNVMDEYCQCIDAGIDLESRAERGRCAYHVPGAYEVGNGGEYRVQLRRVAADGGPDMSAEGLVATAPNLYRPHDYPEMTWPLIPLGSMPVVQGERYFMTFVNLKPPLATNYRSGLPLDEALAQPLDRGAMSFNGIMYPDSTSEPEQFGPVFSGTAVYRSDDGTSWARNAHDMAPWHIVGYDNGVREGFTVYASSNQIFTAGARNSDTNVRYIQGQERGRQTVVPNHDFTSDRVFIYAGYIRNASSTDHLTVQVKTAEGAVVGSAVVSVNTDLQEIINGTPSTGRYGSADIKAANAMAWHEGVFDSDVTLSAGQTYYIEWSADSGAGWRVPSYQTRRGSVGTTYYDPEHQGVLDVGGYAQASTDGGSTWGVYPRNTDRDNNHAERLAAVLLGRKR